MKKIIIALLWASFLLSGTFATDNTNFIDKNINSIKLNIKATNTLPQQDINDLLAFFDQIKAELEKWNY